MVFCDSKARSQIGAVTVFLVALMVCCCFVVTIYSETMSRRAVAPINISGYDKPVAVIRIQRMGIECRRKGFFRISLLRYPFAEQVELELRNPNAGLNSVAEFQSHFAAHIKASRIEIRSFRMIFGAGPPLLEAESLEFDPIGDWQLKKGILRAGGREVRFEDATFHVHGLEAGDLQYRRGEVNACRNLFCQPLSSY